jgi:hypothetical protein
MSEIISAALLSGGVAVLALAIFVLPPAAPSALFRPFRKPTGALIEMAEGNRPMNIIEEFRFGA